MNTQRKNELQFLRVLPRAARAQQNNRVCFSKEIQLLFSKTQHRLIHWMKNDNSLQLNKCTPIWKPQKTSLISAAISVLLVLNVKDPAVSPASSLHVPSQQELRASVR